MKDFLNNKNSILILLLVIGVLLCLNIATSEKIKRYQVLSFESQEQADYPILKTSFLPQISARGAIIMDAASGVVLFEKNPNLRFSSASTTKIMTALTALEYFELEDMLTVKQATNEGVILGLKPGQQMTFENLLYALLLPSTNDTALTIAQNYEGSDAAFVEKMNENARKFNLYNTHFDDPAGLLDDGDYTTPLDLARLASIAIKNETFAKVVSTKNRTIADSAGNSYKLNNLNKLLGIDGVEGIKTGYTEAAGQVLVTSKEEKGKTIIIVVMGSKDRFADTQKLINLVSDNITYLPIHP